VPSFYYVLLSNSTFHVLSLDLCVGLCLDLFDVRGKLKWNCKQVRCWLNIFGSKFPVQTLTQWYRTLKFFCLSMLLSPWLRLAFFPSNEDFTLVWAVLTTIDNTLGFCQICWIFHTCYLLCSCHLRCTFYSVIGLCDFHLLHVYSRNVYKRMSYALDLLANRINQSIWLL